MQISATDILDKEVKTQEPVAGATTDGASPAVSQPEFSSKLEGLLKRETANVQRERALKAKEAELEALRRDAEGWKTKISEFDSVKTNPKKALELLGLDYNELTQSMLKDGEVPPEVEIKRLREELQAYKESQDIEKQNLKLEAEKKSKEAEGKAIEGFKTEIGQYITDNTSRYELINFENAQELVFELIDENYKRTIDPETGAGKVMTISEACDKVEQHLEEKYNKSKDLAKIKAFWGVIPKPAQEKLAKQELKPTAPKTLTNQLSASPMQAKKAISEEEKIRMAIANVLGKRGV